jgi:cyclic pyranopterin phosphate synthase
VFRLNGAVGTIGFISPLSDHFCGSCNRIRLTADGNLRPCLLSDLEIPLLPALRAGKPILPLLEQAVKIKPASHHLDTAELPEKRKMKEIGG